MTTTATVTTEDLIRTSYYMITDRTPGKWVSLTTLRVWLSHIDRAEQDRALRALERRPDVNLVPESNQKTLTQADRDAAVEIGEQKKHLIWIAA